LAAAESGAVFKFLFERSGGQRHEQVGGSVEDYRDCAEDYELREDVAGLRGNELRDERQKEERGLGIERFGEDALAEGVVRGSGGGRRHLGVAGANHTDAEPDEVGGSSVLHGVKGDGGGGENRGDSEGGGKDVEESAEEGAEGGEDAFAAASCERAGEDVEDARAGRDGEQQRGGQEEREALWVGHEEILAWVGEIGEWGEWRGRIGALAR
jgi:hypothetical protein